MSLQAPPPPLVVLSSNKVDGRARDNPRSSPGAEGPEGDGTGPLEVEGAKYP